MRRGRPAVRRRVKDADGHHRRGAAQQPCGDPGHPLPQRGGVRAALGKHTGRNRSTIGSLVTDLVELGLVVEQDPGAIGQIGRPSPIVTLRPEVVAIAVNPEIDALTIGLVGLDGAVRRVIRHEYERIPTASEVLSITSAVISGMAVELAELTVVGIGVAVPGQVRTVDGVVRNAPHLGWHDEAFGAPLAKLTGYPVAVANDAALGALAEHEFGVGRSHENLIYVNGGASGIGGGVIVGGRLLGGASGYAGELGHVRVSSSDTRDSAGIAGTLEAEVTRAELAEVLGLTRVAPDEFDAALLADRSEPVAAVWRGRPAVGHRAGRGDQSVQPRGDRPRWLPRRVAGLRSGRAGAGGGCRHLGAVPGRGADRAGRSGCRPVDDRCRRFGLPPAAGRSGLDHRLGALGVERL